MLLPYRAVTSFLQLTNLKHKSIFHKNPRIFDGKQTILEKNRKM